MRLRRVARVLDSLARKALLLGVLALALAVPPAVFTVKYTARSEYCNSCHLMEPYYRSWQESSHSDVACIECHYEPGVVETVEGKFKALSQLAKYVTRTQGTKPWAEVSDQSCMRSGCHAIPELDGTIAFEEVKFDHHPHLLDTSGGRKLRCTSCHNMIVQGEHFRVSEGVCFACHFTEGGTPAEEGLTAAALAERHERKTDCLTCHDSPTGTVLVAGRTFSHSEYTGRGVSCTECHTDVVRGTGAVRPERCQSCHSETAYLARRDEPVFLHEKHVTEARVECFECHDQVRHGLFPEDGGATAAGASLCGRCHADPHEASRRMLAGTGTTGVPDRPSRMHETRVTCSACHTGRSASDAGDAPASAVADGGPHGGAVLAIAAAGEVDCLHCHGPRFAGMLAEWQTVVGDALGELEPLVDELGDQVDGADADARAHWTAARERLELVRMDRSRGAHNPVYAVEVLRSGAEHVQQAFALVDPGRDVDPASDLPAVSADGCSACHLGVATHDPLTVHARPFSHARHLRKAGLDCSRCHSVEAHGAPSFPRDECASCHHQETETLDPSECGSCHATQEAFLAGDPDGFEPLPGAMQDKTCDTCHGEPPDIMIPPGELCALCHDETYSEKLESWRTTTDELVGQLARAADGAADPAARDAAREALRAVRADGSHGVHNFPLVERILRDALARLR